MRAREVGRKLTAGHLPACFTFHRFHFYIFIIMDLLKNKISEFLCLGSVVSSCLSSCRL